MRNIIAILAAVLLFSSVSAQAPQKISYQSIIRDANNNLVTSQIVSMRISILQNVTPVYVETYDAVTTNDNGLVTLEIGTGNTTDNFSLINWANGTFYIKTETDPTGGTNYTIIGTSQLLSVPYALHANSADNFTGEITFTENDPIFAAWDKTTGITISESQISNLSHFTNEDETDPVYSQSVASGITATDTSNWNSVFSSYTEIDPVFLNSQAANITSTDIDNLSHLSGINTGDQDLSNFLSEETDPIYSSSPATNITTTDISKLSDLSGLNTGDQSLVLVGNQLSITNGNTINLPGSNSIIPIYTTAEITSLTPTEGQALYNNTENLYQIYDGAEWRVFHSDCWPQPTVANAGNDLTSYNGTISITLDANAPITGHGIGNWSVISGVGGSFNNASINNAIFTGQLFQAYQLVWTISTACNQSSDTVNILFSQEQVTDYDGNVYNAVVIGNQTWMAENLKASHYPDGTAIPLVQTNAAWIDLGYDQMDPAFCYVNNDINSEYGALYTWQAAMHSSASTNNNPSGVQGVCPDGWHMPSRAEWEQLRDFITSEGYVNTEGSQLKSTSGWAYSGYNNTDRYGFNAIPAGKRDSSTGVFHLQGEATYFWSTLIWTGNAPIFIELAIDEYFRIDYEYPNHGRSVRCIKN